MAVESLGEFPAAMAVTHGVRKEQRTAVPATSKSWLLRAGVARVPLPTCGALGACSYPRSC
jgi:hypothetical protein